MINRRLYILAVFFSCSGTLSAQVTIADAGPDQELCSSNAYLQGNAAGVGEVGSWSIISGLAAIMDNQDPGSQITATGFGVIVLRWTITDGVNTSSDDVAVWLYDGNAPWADAGPDQTVIIPPNSAQLQGSPYVFPMNCFWTIVAGVGVISDPTDPFAVYFGGSIGQNILVWNCDNGPCGSSSDEVAITFEEATALGWIPAMSGIHVAYDRPMGQLAIIGHTDIDRVIIHDQSGRVVLDGSMNTRSSSLDVSQLAIGAYCLRVMAHDTLYAERFVIVR